jgi:hypothetical protein
MRRLLDDAARERHEVDHPLIPLLSLPLLVLDARYEICEALRSLAQPCSEAASPQVSEHARAHVSWVGF